MAVWQRQHQLPVVGDRDFGGARWHRPDTRHNLTHSHATIAASPIALREAAMLNTYERHVITGYLSNMANRFGRESPEAGGIVEWLTENAGLLGFDRRSFDLDSEPFDSKEEMSAKQWRVCRRILDQAAESTASVRNDRLIRRLRRLGRIIKLSAEEISVLQLLLRYQIQPEFEDLLDTVANSGRRGFHHGALNLKNRLASSALGISGSTLRRRLADDAPLVRSGLVFVEDDQDVSSLERLRSMVWGGGSEKDVRKLLLGATRPTELEWSDFDHLGQPRSDVENLLQGALDTGKRGVNVLIHGPPGTGKTEFCRVLAKRMDVEMFSIGEADAAAANPRAPNGWANSGWRKACSAGTAVRCCCSTRWTTCSARIPCRSLCSGCREAGGRGAR